MEFQGVLWNLRSPYTVLGPSVQRTTSPKKCHAELFLTGLILIKGYESVAERLVCILQTQSERETELQAQVVDVPMLINMRHTTL